MTTFAQLQSFIADDLDRTDLTTQIQNAINRAIHRYETEGFWFQETNDIFSTVANQVNYTTASIPSDIIMIVDAKVTISGTDYQLKPRDITWIQKQDPTNNTGDPSYFAWFQNQIWLSPTPNAVNTVTLYYIQSYSDLSADADTNAFTNDSLATDLIRAHAEWILYTQLLGDPTGAALSKEEEMRALSRLRRKTNNYKLGVPNATFQG